MTAPDRFEFKEIDCPACGGGDSNFVGYRGGEAHHSGEGVKTSIVRCRSCSHQYPNPMPFPTLGLDALYSDADTYFLGHDTAVKKQNGLDLMKKFEQKTSRRGKFLDVGCGTGTLLWAAKESGWDAQGVDPSTEFIDIGYKTLGVKGQVGTLEEAAFPDNSFDAIAMSSLIEHLFDPYETLREVYRVLRPDGWLWFDAPNEDGLYIKFGNLYLRLQGKDWVVVMAPTFPPFHVQGFNPRSLSTLLTRAKFELKGLDVAGETCGQAGKRSFRRALEDTAARNINRIGKLLGKGIYMSIWAQKRVDVR